MKTNFTKETKKGTLSIEVLNGTATVSLNGQRQGTTGLVQTLSNPVEKEGVVYVAQIFGYGLTNSEAQELKEMLGVQVASQGSRSQYVQTMREVHGDINQFAKGGAL